MRRAPFFHMPRLRTPLPLEPMQELQEDLLFASLSDHDVLATWLAEFQPRGRRSKHA